VPDDPARLRDTIRDRRIVMRARLDAWKMLHGFTGGEIRRAERERRMDPAGYRAGDTPRD
jgi:hypothetical protein